MKVTVVTNEYDENGGGLAFSCRRFVEMLRTIGHEVVVLTSSVNPHEIIKGGYNPKLGYELAMERKLKSDECLIDDRDLIISFGGGKNGYYGALLACKRHTKFWVMFRGSDANLGKWDSEQTFCNNFACEKAELIICLSNEMAENLKLFCKHAAKFAVIPNYAIPKGTIVKELNIVDRLVIGTGATNLNEKKGVAPLLEVISNMTQIMPDIKIRLDLVGHIDEDVKAHYEKIVNVLGLKGQVSFYGRKNRREFLMIQSSWHFYIQTSICEGMCNSVVDAMTLGIPVAISNTGFVAEYAEDRFPQIVFSSSDPRIIAEEFRQLLLLPDLRERYQDFYEVFFNTIDPGNVAKQWQELFGRDILKIERPCKSECILSVSLHDVQGVVHDNITTPITVFEKFAEDVHSNGYRLCSMKEYMQSSPKEKQSLIVCTFDDGYEGLVKNALPIMSKYNYTATVYVCTDYFGKFNDWNYKDKIRRRHMDVSELNTLQGFNWEIGSHGVSHQSLLRLNDEEIQHQLSESKQILEQNFGDVTSYAYPYGDFSPYIEKQVEKYYANAFLLTQGSVYLPIDIYRIRRYYISEIYQIIKGL